MNLRCTFRHYCYLVISLVMLVMIMSANISLQTATAHSNSDTSYNMVVIHGKTFTISNQITGGRVNNITGEKDNRTLLVGILSKSNGTLTIEVPRNVIDSKKQGTNVDDPYTVFADDQYAQNFDEIKNSTKARVLSINFDNGTKQIEIVGSQMASAMPPQITRSTPVTIKVPANVTVPASQITNVTKTPVNVTATRAPINVTSGKVPANATAPSNSIKVAAPRLKTPANATSPPSLEELAGENATKAPINITGAAAQAHVSAPPPLEELAGKNFTKTPAPNATASTAVKTTMPKSPITSKVRTSQHHFCIFGSVSICL
jgi:hypothetical protein